MKPIQHYIKNCNKQSVIDLYLHRFGFSSITLMREELKNVPIGAYIENLSNNLSDLIDRLSAMKPLKDNSDFVFITVHGQDDGYDDIYFNLYKISELKGDNIPVSYSYIFDKAEEALSFLVADNYLTQFYIDDLIADFLHEISWFGYNQEYLEEEKEKLEDSVKSCTDNNSISFEDFKKELDFELEKRDPDEEKAWKDFIKSSSDYYIKCQEIEIKKFKESLC